MCGTCFFHGPFTGGGVAGTPAFGAIHIQKHLKIEHRRFDQRAKPVDRRAPRQVADQQWWHPKIPRLSVASFQPPDEGLGPSHVIQQSLGLTQTAGNFANFPVPSWMQLRGRQLSPSTSLLDTNRRPSMWLSARCCTRAWVAQMAPSKAAQLCWLLL